MHSVSAETLVAARTIPSQTTLNGGDLVTVDGVIPGAFSDALDVIGMETRVVLYAGRPIRRKDVRPAAIVDRNEIVTLIFENGGLSIFTEARSLGRAAAGEKLRVMNLASKTTISGVVRNDGAVVVGPTIRHQSK